MSEQGRVENNAVQQNKKNAGSSYHAEILKRRMRYTLVFVVLAFAFVLVTVININTGNVDISVGRILRAVFLRSGTTDDMNIIWKIRLPRILMAAILGGALSLSGFLLQTFFENPIAGPFVLGISSGAKMIVAVIMILVVARVGAVSSWAMILAAFAGSLLSTGFILLVSRTVRNMSALLVAGIMIGYICTAVTNLLVTFAADSDIANLHNWSQGSFSGMTWDNVYIGGGIVAVAVVLVFLMAKPIGAFQLGEAYAQSMGVNVKQFRIALILLSSILSATVTAFAGPISFVGIAVPFLIKRALHTASPVVVIPAAFLGGAVFCMACDLIARVAFAPTELEISTVTAIFGAPVVIFMLIWRQKGKRA
ncbi:MAG: FecCD family ABC transporter permease [Bilifractor sp.]